jgi:hypothetical protein
VRYVANDVVLRIKNGERGYAFVVHQLESRCQGLVTTRREVSQIPCAYTTHLLDSQNTFRANFEVLDQLWVQLIDDGEALAVFPEERNKAQLCEHTHDICSTLFHDQHSVYPATEDFHSFGQVGRLRQCDERLLLAQIFDVLEWDRLAFSALLCQLVEGSHIFLIRVSEANHKE